MNCTICETSGEFLYRLRQGHLLAWDPWHARNKSIVRYWTDVSLRLLGVNSLEGPHRVQREHMMRMDMLQLRI